MIQISIIETDAAMDYLRTQASIEEHPEWGFQPDSKELFEREMLRLKGRQSFLAKISINGRQMSVESSEFERGEHKEAMQELMTMMAENISAELSRKNEQTP
jgi:hypothetical protein